MKLTRGYLLPLLMTALVLLWSAAGVVAQESTPAPAAPAAAETAQAPAAAAPADAAAYITPGMPDQIKEAINQSLAEPKNAEALKKAIDPSREPGFMGIPGAPPLHYVWGFLWAIWVGWIFSTVGAFGGVMAGVGHITIFGLGDYAKSFGKGSPMNALVTDSIRVSNQWLVGLSALISTFNYYKMGRLVVPLGICLAIGSVAGSYLVPELTAGKVSLKDYLGYFGLCVLLLGCILLYETTPRGQASKKAAKEAAAAFESQTRSGKADSQGVQVVGGSYGGMIAACMVVLAGAIWGNVLGDAFPGSRWVAIALAAGGVVLGFVVTASQKIRFTFFGVEFAFKGYIPIIGGLVIAALAAFLGVGGGFLFVPFLTSVAGLPMFLVAGTSAMAVLVGMIVSISTYMVGKGVPVEWAFIGAELLGIFVGSMIGPRTSKYIPDRWLKILFVILAFYVGIRYFSKGFFGESWLP